MTAVAVATRRPAPPAGLLSPRKTSRRLVGLVACAVAVLLVCWLSLAIGTRSIPMSSVWDAIANPDPTNTEHLVILELRLPAHDPRPAGRRRPRVGRSRDAGGDPQPAGRSGHPGVNGGAALFVVLAIAVFGVTSVLGYVWFAFAGAAVAAVTVYSIASFGRDGATPIKLALAGAALTAAFGAVTTAFLLMDEQTFDQFRFWQVGALAGRDMSVVVQVAPFLIVGCLFALALGRVLNTLSLGEDVARGLGASTVLAVARSSSPTMSRRPSHPGRVMAAMIPRTGSAGCGTSSGSERIPPTSRATWSTSPTSSATARASAWSTIAMSVGCSRRTLGCAASTRPASTSMSSNRSLTTSPPARSSSPAGGHS